MHRRATHACFLTPDPPNLGLSAQLWQTPQSPRLHGKHLPQRLRRGPIFLSPLPRSAASTDTSSSGPSPRNEPSANRLPSSAASPTSPVRLICAR
eukprot:5289074-Prymnesium_polylepis.1